MKKLISIIFCLCLVLCVGGLLIACGDTDTTPTGENSVKAPVSYSINASGELIGTYEDQTTINHGSLLDNIANGVQSITVNEDGYYVINNVSTIIKEIQAPKPVSYAIDTNGNLIVTYSDRSTKNEGKFGQDAINTIETVAVSEDGYYVLNGIKTTIQVGDATSDIQENSIIFHTLSVDGLCVNGCVANSVSTFDFSNEITANGNSDFSVCLDENGINSSITKKMALTEGDNIFYVIETINGVYKQTYTVNIHRNCLFRIWFNTNGGGTIESQEIEEGYLAIKPSMDPTKLGYTFVNWNYDFNTPITNNVIISATWEVNDEMSDFIFTSSEQTCQISGVTDSTITTIIVPDYVTHIGYYAFRDCKLLTNITIGKNVKSIGQYAFYGCDSLTKVNYTGTIDDWAQIEFSFASSHPFFYTDNFYINNLRITEVNIATATTISSYAFAYCGSLTNLTVGSSVKSIGTGSFEGCSSISSIIIGDNVTSIGESAFSGCTSLNNITIGKNVTNVSRVAFSGCKSLETVNYLGTIDEWVQIKFNDNTSNPINYSKNLYINSQLVTDATLSSATIISTYVFSGCTSLKSIIIPNTITAIGAYAFDGCNSLISIKYLGTETEWNAISKGSNWDNSTGNYTITYN